MRSEAETPPAFGICGSVSEVTNRQIHEAEKAGIQLVSVSIPIFFEEPPPPGSMKKSA